MNDNTGKYEQSLLTSHALAALRVTLPRTIIITGAAGSGKTEFVLALAPLFARECAVTVLDLDFVNPYFRAQDHQRELTAAGIRVLAPDEAVAVNDAPSMPPAARDALLNPRGLTIADLGGDPAGAIVIGQYAPDMVEYEMWAVINYARPVASQGKIAGLLSDITRVTRLRLSGLVSNSYYGRDTNIEEVLDGYQQTALLAEQLSLPVICACVPASLAPEAAKLPVPVLPIHRQLLRPWE